MAKGNMLLGQARGKVGDIVFSRNNGKQVIKARSEQVKNPQTQSQVLQRILLNTVSQAYSKMLAICDHSFEGVKTGQDTMSMFMKRNLSLMRAKVVNHKNTYGSLSGIYAVTPIGMKAVAINPYIMSIGSLPPISISEFEQANGGDWNVVINVPGVSGTITYGDLISAFGLQRGDQLTFCQLTDTVDQGIMFNYARVILDPTNADGTPAALTEPVFDANAVLMPSERNSGQFARVNGEDGEITFSVAGGTPVAACVIVSRQDITGEWMRSNSVLTLKPNFADFNQYALLDAIDLFYSGGIDFESAWYLNNATSGSGETSETPAVQTPRLQSLTAGGQTILGGSSALEVNAGAVAIAGTQQYYDSEANSKVIITTRTLTLGEIYAADAADLSVAANSQTFNGSVTLVADTNYKTYWVSGGYIRTAHRAISCVSGSSDPNPGAGQD